ncbi:hypothetical protein [Rhizobium leguminosarum]|uniref:hypothetical protein n=1 Tax=Rhizobium TaxID=379 RepID=UPI0035E46152
MLCLQNTIAAKLLGEKTGPALAHIVQGRDCGRNVERLQIVDWSAGEDTDFAAARRQPVGKQNGIQSVAAGCGETVLQSDEFDHVVETRNQGSPKVALEDVAALRVCGGINADADLKSIWKRHDLFR